MNPKDRFDLMWNGEYSGKDGNPPDDDEEEEEEEEEEDE